MPVGHARYAMVKKHRHTIHKERRHVCWDNAIPPALMIAPGDEVAVQTVDAGNGQLTPQSTAADIARFDFDNVNPVTGPIYVDGAEPGDQLAITVLGMAPSGWGWSANIPGFGLLAEDFPEPHLHHWHYDPMLARPVLFGAAARVPFKPLIGSIGVAPAAAGPHDILPPREIGGTMDIRDIGTGTVLRLPVVVPGALLSLGDTHAAQGDGEVCGTGVESAIDVELKIELVKETPLPSPVFATPGPVTRHLDSKGYDVTTGIGPDLMACAKDAVRRMVERLSGNFGIDPVEAYILCSVCGDLRISEIVDRPNWIVSLYFPRCVFD